MSKTKKPLLSTPRRLVYLQDNQLWYTTPFLFETNCPEEIGEMELISEGVPHAGRLSASFEAFKKAMEARGFSCTLVEKFADKAPAPAGYQVVKGATGNY